MISIDRKGYTTSTHRKWILKVGLHPMLPSGHQETYRNLIPEFFCYQDKGLISEVFCSCISSDMAKKGWKRCSFLSLTKELKAKKIIFSTIEYEGWTASWRRKWNLSQNLCGSIYFTHVIRVIQDRDIIGGNQYITSTFVNSSLLLCHSPFGSARGQESEGLGIWKNTPTCLLFKQKGKSISVLQKTVAMDMLDNRLQHTTSKLENAASEQLCWKLLSNFEN